MPYPRLPSEMLDDVVDNLRDAGRGNFKNCCLVSKSWVHRARKHLFFHVAFSKAGDLESWQATFPDPSTSPARYAKHMSVGCPQAAAATYGEGSFISNFFHVLRLDVHLDERETPSAHVSRPRRPAVGVFPASCIFNLITSFPHLEELNATNFAPDGDNRSDGRPAPNLPPSMRTVCLNSIEGIGPIANRILSPPGSLHLSSLELTLHSKEDVDLAAALVERCSSLKSLRLDSKITCESFDACVYANG